MTEITMRRKYMNTSRVYPFTVGEAPSAAFIMTVDGVPTHLHIARVSAAPINRRWA